MPPWWLTGIQPTTFADAELGCLQLAFLVFGALIIGAGVWSAINWIIEHPRKGRP